MGNVFWMGIALVAGGLLPFLGTFNARLGAAIASPLYASVVSFAIGTVVISTFVLATRQSVSWAGAATAPWYAWLGGFCGAFSLTAIILTYPKIRSGTWIRIADCGTASRRSGPGALQRAGGGTSPH
jgi:bacterial/archaeal transporter family-2 protein